MQTTIRKKADTFHKQGTKRRLWQRIVSGLTCIVVFCTTYALILPAITLEGEAFCGVAEHTHAESCYNGTVMLTCSPAHVHSSECYGADAGLICGQSDYVVHSHDTICYGADGALLCVLPEIVAHVHGDSCYTQVMPEGHVHEELCYTTEQGAQVCGLEGSEGHGHGDGCYGEQVLICQIAESAGHAHAAECYSESVLSCGQEETEGHAHDTAICYGEDGSLICQLPEAAAHGHGETCYTQELLCGQEVSEGHIHGEGCYEIPLVCTVPESEGHVHSDGCYEWIKTLVCGQEEVQPQSVLTCTVANETVHVHTETCLTQPELVCVQEEHIHALECYSDANADVETEEFWRSTMAGADLSGSDAQDLVSIAQTQLGYSESARNYAVLADGITIKGYTRYGAWAGTPYADWNELFVKFCLYYAGIEKADLPWSTGGASWIQTLSEAGLYYNKEAGTPDSGDLIFLNLENKTYAGIVTRVSEGYVTVTLGDYKNEVRSETFTLSDGDILGYASLRTEVSQQAPEAPATEIEAAVAETTTAMETTSETTQPVTETTESTEVTGTTETTVETTAETTETTEATEETAETTEATEVLEEIESVEDLIVNPAMVSALLELAEDGIAGSSADLTDFLTNVVFLDSNGNPIVYGGTLHPGESYSITLAFAETPSLQFSQTMTFQLPVGISIPAEITGSLSKGGNTVANYTITTDGLLVVNFIDDWQNNYQDASFTIDFNGTIATENDQIIFTEKHTFDIENPQPELNAWKFGSFTPDSADADGKITGGTLDYEVTVTAKNTSADGIVIKDTLTSTENCVLSFNEGSFVVTDSSGNVVDPSNYTITYDENEQGFTLTFKDDYQLAEDAQLKISYSVDVANMTNDSYIGFNQNNKVVVNGNDGNDAPLEDTAEKSVWISVNNTVQKSVNKSGTAAITPENAAENAETGMIDWKVDIINGNGLAGATVTDTLGDGLTWDGGAITVTCVVIDAEGNESTKVLTIDHSAVTQGKDENGKTTLTFTLPETDSSGNTISYKQATLIYSTNYDLLGVPTNGSESYQNSVKVDEPGGEGTTGSSSSGVTVPGIQTTPTTTQKELQTTVDSNNGHTILNYTITVDVPGLENGYSPFYVEDTMSVGIGWNFTPIKLKKDAVISFSSTVTKAETGETVNVPYTYEVGSDGKLYVYYNGSNVDTSSWNVAEDASITIQYSVDLRKLLEANTSINGQSLSAMLADNNILRNTAINHFAERNSEPSYADYSENAKLEKSGQLFEDENGDTYITYTVLLNGLTAPIRESIYNSGSAYFTDKLPSGWSYVSGSFYVEAKYVDQYWNKFTYPTGEDPSVNAETNVLTADIKKLEYNYLNLFECIGDTAGKQGQSALTGLRFTYTLKATDNFKNSVSGYDQVNVVNKANFGWGDHELEEAESVVEYGRNPLDKSATQDGTKNNLIHFSIDINALQDDLSPDTDLLTITDTMSSVLDFDINSLQVINVSTSEVITGYTTNYLQGQDSNTLTITGLPDSTHLRITYDAYVNETGTVSFTNTVELKGKAEWKDDVDSGSITVTDKGGADGSTGKFYIHKVDGNTGGSLSGAKFEMYLVGNAEVDIKDTDLDLDENKTGHAAGGKTYSHWYDLGDYSVWELENQPGWFQAGFNNPDWDGESKYIVEMYTAYGYRLVLIETEAPAGYEKLQEPIVIAYSDGDGVYEIPGSNNETKQYSFSESDNVVDYAGTITIENTPLMDISVNKVWSTTSGGTPSITPDIEVALMQVAHYGYEEEVVPAETHLLTINLADSSGNVLSTKSYNIGNGVTVSLTHGNIFGYSEDKSITIVGRDGTSKVISSDVTNSNYNCVFEFKMDQDYTYTDYSGNQYWTPTISVTWEVEKVQKPGTYETALYTATLNSGNNWSASWNDLKLPTTGTVTVDGVTYDCTYTYYVKELTAGEWTTTYSVDNITIGTNNLVTITNTYDEPAEETTQITVKKEWLAKDGETSITTPDMESIQFYLKRRIDDEENEYVDNPDVTDEIPNTPYTLTPTNANWSMTISNLPVKDSNGNTYTYSVEEKTDGLEKYSVSYSNNGDVVNNEVTITNTVNEEVYELPETGGTGTMMYTLGGLAMCGWACLQYNHKKRRKEDQTS